MKQEEQNSIADVLLAQGAIMPIDLERAKTLKVKIGGRLEEALLNQGSCSQEDILAATATRLELPRLSSWLELKEIDAVSSMPESYGLSAKWWREQQAFPLGEIDGVIWLALADVHDDFVPGVLRQKANKKVTPVVIGGPELRQLHALLDERGDAGVDMLDPDSLRGLATGAPIVQFVNDTIQRAIDAKASDIHFESYRGVFRVRVRVDGVLHEIDRPNLNLQAAIVSRVKLMANLDISEKRLPQDGRIRTRVSGRDLDIRVATTPGVAGESLVLRLLDKEEGVASINDLDLFADHHGTVNRLLSATNGIILVTGPTGSGKTTSLYTFLKHLSGDERKIITVEDPVEYETSGISQIQVQSEIGLDFATILRSVLRQDPDIILIGEIRDRETAEIAVQAALTGHLVLTTLHTNDAPGSFVRLMDMGVEDYLLATSVIGVLAQRLVRRSCPHCQQPDEQGRASADAMGFAAMRDKWPELTPEVEFKVGTGCKHCLGTGFQGRRSIFEMFEVDEEIRHLISTRPEGLDQLLAEKNMRRLKEDGLLRAALGQTSVAEVLRVTG
jgi:type II secretory ATPase GspE/PulE/Tfp pilus assembly ATPase PilB-like protein